MPTDRKLTLIIGERLRALRLQNKWSQEKLAQKVGIKTDTLRHIEKGRNDPRIMCLSSIAKELRVDLSALIYREQQNADSADRISWQPDEAVNLTERMTKRDLIMDRRSALMALTATLISGPALIDSLQGWLIPLGRASGNAQSPEVAMGKLGIEEIAQIKQAAKSLYEWQDRFGSGPCRKAAIGLLNEVVVALKERQSPQIERELFGVMADLGNTVATMTWQSGLESAAQDYYMVALRGARAANDQLFGARILAGLSRQQLYQGKAQEALELIHLAQQGTRLTAGRQVKSMLYLRESWALAALGREEDFQRANALAQESAAKAKLGDEPDWIAPFCADDELAGIAGAGLTELAKHQPEKYAERACEQAFKALEIRGKEVSRLTALHYIDIAESRFLLNDTELGSVYAQKAINIGSSIYTNCGQVRSHLINLYHYTRQHTKSGAVCAVHTQMKTLLGSV